MLGVLFSVTSDLEARTLKVKVYDPGIFTVSSVFLFGSLSLLAVVTHQFEEQKYLEALPTSKALRDFTREHYKISTGLQNNYQLVEPLEKSSQTISNELIRLESLLQQGLEREKSRESQRSFQLTEAMIRSLKILERAIKNSAATPDIASIYQDVNTKLITEFNRVGISTIQPQAGDTFEEAIHIWHGEVDQPNIERGKIIQCHEQGYQVNGEVRDKAKVVISKGNSSTGHENT